MDRRIGLWYNGSLDREWPGPEEINEELKMSDIKDKLDGTKQYALFVDPRYPNSISMCEKDEYIGEHEVRMTEWAVVHWFERDRDESIRESVASLNDQIQVAHVQAQDEMNILNQRMQELLALPSL